MHLPCWVQWQKWAKQEEKLQNQRAQGYAPQSSVGEGGGAQKFMAKMNPFSKKGS